MSIRIEHLTKHYGVQKAVNDISFSVDKGEIVGFLGPNGAGKSTTMKILTCYILPTYGEASVCGNDIYHQSRAVRESIGYLPEHNPLYSDMYVREYLGFMANVHGLSGSKKRQRIREMVEVTGLGPEVQKKLGQLSKGYRQRVGLAQAMLHDPEVLILDEPTSGLDPNQIVEIREVIRELGQKKTVLLSTHIMQEVKAVCNRVLIIHNGSIVADDDTQGIIDKYSGKKRLKVAFKKAVEKEELLAIEGVENVLSDEAYWILETSKDVDLREAVFNFAVNNNNMVLELSQEEQTLEQAFQQLTSDKRSEQ